MKTGNNVDCSKGRQIGCQTYCCRLIVRLDPEERDFGNGSLPASGAVEKGEDGYCIHLDRESCFCGIWNHRPVVCRDYNCNDDFLLQVALKEPVTSLVRLVQKAQSVFIPKESYIRIPCNDECDVNRNEESFS